MFNMNTIKANREDSKEILRLQMLAYQSEAELYNDYNIPPLTQTLDEIESQFVDNLFLKIIDNDSIIASIRAYKDNDTCYIGRVIVHPDYQNRGFGKVLMRDMESLFRECKRYELFTGSKSIKNIQFYEKLNYRIFKSEKLSDEVELVYLEKWNSAQDI